jgi:hypothetical protein
VGEEGCPSGECVCVSCVSECRCEWWSERGPSVDEVLAQWMMRLNSHSLGGFGAKNIQISKRRFRYEVTGCGILGFTVETVRFVNY